MPRNLAKKAAKQQSRIAALNALGTPASSRAASEDEDDLDVGSEASFGTVDSTSLLDESTLEDELRRAVDDLGEKRTRLVVCIYPLLNVSLMFLVHEKQH